MKTVKSWLKILLLVTASHWMASFAASEEIALGSIQAPVTLIEYGSLTCDYCINFHQNILPRIKKLYIDAGTVRFIYRHFPTSQAAAQAAHATQCAGEKFYNMLEELYFSVPTWYQAENRGKVFVQYAVSLGLNSETFQRCLGDTKHSDQIEHQQQAARKDFDVEGTPTFLINGKIVRGKQSFKEMKVLIQQALDKDK